MRLSHEETRDGLDAEQSRQVKRTPQDSINELIIWKRSPVVVPVTSVKFKSAFPHNEVWIFNQNISISGQIENLWLVKIEDIYIKF